MRIDTLIGSYVRTRRAMGFSPQRLAAHRLAQWRLLQDALARTPALAVHVGKPLAEFPMVSQAQLRTDYGHWNSLGLTDAELRTMADAAERGETAGGLSAGWSTGSGGGARGLFVADAVERADYIGQSLARLLPPRALLHRQRLALHLRANSALYSDVGNSRFAFAHFPIEAAPGETLAALRGFAPTILVAPPHRLLALADLGELPGLAHLFYGSEPMSEAERSHVASQLGLMPQPIYQATEGFFGAACRHGRLHLGDHSLEIELEPVPGTHGFRPVITDLRRRSQPIVRLRGDDFLELPGEACPCGFAGRAIAPVAGRVQDVWRFGALAITPAEIVGTVERALGLNRWQAVGGPREAVLRIAPDCPPILGERAARALAEELPLPVPVVVRPDLPPWPGPKRRKVAWSDG